MKAWVFVVFVWHAGSLILPAGEWMQSRDQCQRRLTVWIESRFEYDKEMALTPNLQWTALTATDDDLVAKCAPRASFTKQGIAEIDFLNDSDWTPPDIKVPEANWK